MIKVFVQKTMAQAVVDTPLTSGSKGLTVEFVFSEDWNGLEKTAVFETSSFYKETEQLTGETIEVPEDVMAWANETLYVGVYGTAQNGATVIPTVYADCGRIQKGANDSEGGRPLIPAQSDILQNQINDLGGRVGRLESGGGISLDTTLTQSGKAADAKAVGDALEQKQDAGNYLTDHNTFVGGVNTSSVAFYEAFSARKPCFLLRPDAGGGMVMWVAHDCTSRAARFYNVASDGTVRYATLEGRVFSYESAAGGSGNVFVGDANTTVAEFYEADNAGKVCFMRRPQGGSGIVTWVAYNCSTSGAWFYHVNSTGMVEYGRLGSDGLWSYTSAKVDVDTTLSISGMAADAKAVGDALAELEAQIPESGGGITEESDPTVPDWAKAETKPTYTAEEVGAMAANAAVVKSVNGTAPDANGNVTVEAGGGGSGGDAVVTAEKAYAASVLELSNVATNQYVAQHNSVLFEATDDTTLSVGSDNMISGAPVSKSVVPGTLAPTIVVTEVEDGYKYELNPDYTGGSHFQNYRVYFPVNIQNGKTYTLAFKADGDCYLYLSVNGDNTDTLIGGKLIPTVDGKKVLTFTATADYGYARITPNDLPRTLTEITLCEGDVALEYGAGAETYSLSAGEKVWLSGVKGLNCVGAGNFYESPLAVTSFNGVAPSTGAVKSCATKKTWVNMGDSIWTFGASVGGIGTITDYMVALCGGTWHNIATGGTTMASRPGDYAGTYDALDFWQIADAIVAGNYTDAKAAAAELTSNFANIDNVDWSSVDYVTVAYGTNDLAFGAAIDSESNPLDTATICGALRYGIKTINGKYPNIRFKVLGVVYRSADAVTPAEIVECNEALRAAAAYVGAEFVDGYGINAGNSGTFLYDGTHPNANGKVRIAETLARSIHEVWYE